MLLSLTTTHAPATDLGYLLHKNPARAQSFALSFGSAHVFYPEVGEGRCTAALLLDVDPVALVRSQSARNSEGRTLAQYVNDRPYVASSFLSVAIAQVFGNALGGRCKDKPEAALTPLPLEARLDVSHRALEIAQDKLNLDRLPPMQRERISLLHSLLIYRDKRLEGYDAAAVVKVIEHLDPLRLAAFERSVFEFARPSTVVITTTNAEYNPKFGTLPAGKFRHKDHRFE